MFFGFGKFKAGTRVQLGQFAGIYSGKVGTVIEPRLVTGIPVCVGSVGPFNRLTQVMVRLDGPGYRTAVARKRDLVVVTGNVRVPGRAAPAGS